MKRLISMLLTFAVLVAGLTVFANAATSDGVHGYVPGDANDDYEVNMKDILLTRRFVAGLEGRKSIDFLAADVLKDDDVNMKDILLLRRNVAGLCSIDKNNIDEKYRVSSATVGGRNISRYAILIPSDADECMVYSAKRLKEYISDACGVTLNITNSRTSDTYFIEYRLDPDDDYSLGKEGYHVEVKSDGDLVMTCGSMRGCLYVTYYLLEKFIGWRFLNDDIEYLYKNDAVDLPIGFEDTEIPAFEYRGLNQIGSTYDDFAALRLNAVDSEGSYAAANFKYGGGVGNLHAHAHSYAYQMAGIEYAYKNGEIEKMGLFDTQPCLTSEETYEKFIQFNKDIYDMWVGSGKRVPGIHFTMIACSPNDNTEFCKCENCKRVYTEEGSISGTVVRMSNRVAAAQREYMPGVGVYTIAYWDARNAPKHTRPDDDVCICFCFGGCNNHTYDHVEQCAAAGGNQNYPAKVWDIETQSVVSAPYKVSNVQDIDFYTKWTELTNNLYIWYYACNFAYQISPCPNVLNVYNDFKYLASTGTIGIYTEGSSVGMTFELLRGYLASRMMWNPYMSEEEFEGYLDEFLMIYYGDGWSYIKEYLYMQDECGNRQGCFMNNFDRPWNFYNKEYFAENYDYMLGLFNSAYDLAGDGDQRERIKLAQVHVYFLGLSATYDSRYRNGTDEQRAAYKSQYEYLWNLVRYEGYLDGVNENGFQCVDISGSGYGGLDNFPSNPSEVRDTMSWVQNGFNGSW